MVLTQNAGRDAVLTAAANGDPDAFRRLVEPHRAELHAHCYRMLGSLHDAEDALQDALFRAWKGMHAVRGRDGLRAWLSRIATNPAIEVANRRSSRTLPMDHFAPSLSDDHGGEPLTEIAWLEPYPDGILGLADGRSAPAARYEQREAVELAFVAALQHLPPNQRAVLILREVLGYSALEVADTLDTTVASVNSALQRARRSLDERLPATTQHENARALGDARLEALVAEFMDAWLACDLDRICKLLADDATFSMPPHGGWWRGVESILAMRDFARDRCPEGKWVRTEANGQVAF